MLVKHAPPAIDPAVPSPQWTLSAAGEALCPWLAERLAALGVERLASSPEPKALRTAELVGAPLGLAPAVHPGLAENDRSGFPFLSPEAWRARFATFFAEPERRTIGRESAREAGDRFEAAVVDVLGKQTGGAATGGAGPAQDGAEDRAAAALGPSTTAVVAHGTVITLFMARRFDLAPFELWQALGLPSFLVLERSPDGRRLRWDGAIHNPPER